MSALDKNKIFFGLIHYVLSEQNNVDWILKTSLVNFTGINSTVDNKKYKQNSVTDDIIEYIYQVKPYHVTFEQFIEKYSSKQDDVNVTSQDQNNITMYIRYDAITSEYDEQGSMTDYEFMDTHMANRLWYFKHNDLKSVYGNDEAIKDYIKDVMNCHFKGISVEGGDFNLDKSGYDAFLYDSTLYDAPTITSDYCLVNYSEKLQYKYSKQFVKIGLKSFKLDSDKEIYPANIEIISDYNNTQTKIENFNLKNNVITLFSSLRKYEKITIINKVNNIRTGYVFVGHPFIESDDESNLRKFMPLNTNKFPIPDNNLGSKKITVHIEYPNGTRIPTTNFEKDGNDIVIYDTLKENYHVILTVIDYRQIYDKIYTYEDCYGQSNNIITLDGDDFLRPYYEKERPSELCVSYPINGLIVYTQNKNNKVNSLYGIDYKDYQYKMPISNSLTTKLVQDLNIGDKIIIVEDIDRVKKPYFNGTKTIPGRILINSEIIEFYDYETNDNSNGILKNIRRGVLGSFLGEKHIKNSIVYTYNLDTVSDYTSSSVSIMNYIGKNSENKFLIPGEINDINDIEVYKKSYIELLSDITFLGKYFDISSNNIILPGNVNLQSSKIYQTVYKNQQFGLEIAGKTYNISINQDCFSINELQQTISSIVPQSIGFNVLNNNGIISFRTSEGKSIKVSNIEGCPIQEMFGDVTKSSLNNIEIKLDGYNGLKINGIDIIWGNDSHSIEWMKENPSVGGIDEVISTINNLKSVNTLIKAYNRDGYLEIVPLIDETIIFENLTNVLTPEDNIKNIGIDSKIEKQKNVMFENNILSYYEDNTDKLGNIFINNEKIYFKNIQQMAENNKKYYRIFNYFIDKEYKANESIIISVQPVLVDKSEYLINEESKFISFNNKPKEGEVIIIYNKK